MGPIDADGSQMHTFHCPPGAEGTPALSDLGCCLIQWVVLLIGPWRVLSPHHSH